MTTYVIKVIGFVAGIMAVTGFGEPRLVYAAENPDISVVSVPARYSFVDGDVEKYRAHHWIKDNYAGGVKEFSLDGRLPYDISIGMEGRAIIDENNLRGKIDLKKKDLGFFSLDYKEFRKYYDGTGGVYHLFNVLRVNETDKELALNIGHFSLEIGVTPEKLPDLVFLYEREFKDGAKSRLTWTDVREGSVIRKIGPSWQDINERVDVFAIKASHGIAGFALNGEQRWEFVRSETSREEKNLATTDTAADKKIRVQEQEPETNLMTTSFGVERWFADERVLVSGGYRYSRMHNREVESIFEMRQDRAPQNFTNPKQIRDARADNNYDSHTWVGHFMVTPWESVSVSTKFKTEAFQREGNSTYPSDTTLGTPDGIVNTTETSNNRNRIFRLGEGISLRFAGIPRTALYNELEFEQTRNWLSEDRNSLAGQSVPNANEIFGRETITHIYRGIWALGANVVPCSLINLTAQVRHQSNLNDYDDTRETDPGTNTARSAFIDDLKIRTDEFSTRVTIKPYRWLQPAFRYQLRDDDYLPRAENESAVENDMTSHIYTLDVMMQPLPTLLTMASFSKQLASTRTLANVATTANQPIFKGNVSTWLFSASYAARENLDLISTLSYSHADNFDDFASIGLPLGVDNNRLDLTVGLKCKVIKNVSIEPEYAFYHYGANPDAEYSGYNAHLVSVEVSFLWA